MLNICTSHEKLNNFRTVPHTVQLLIALTKKKRKKRRRKKLKYWNGKRGQTLLTAVFTKVRNKLYVSACFLQELQEHWWFPAPDSRFRAFSLLVFMMMPMVVLPDSAVHALSWSGSSAHLKPAFLCRKCSFSSRWSDPLKTTVHC